MVPADVLDKVLEAGTWAPTGMGRQSPVILCVTDKAVRDELARMNREIMIETGMGVKRGMDPSTGRPWSVRCSWTRPRPPAATTATS
jgi:hypothetical protein